MGDSNLEISSYKDVTVATFRMESILDAVVVESLGRALYALVERDGARKIIVDLRGVRHVSSSMLGVFLTLHKKSQAADARMVLCGARPEVLRVFEIVNLARIIPLADDGAAAIKALAD